RTHNVFVILIARSFPHAERVEERTRMETTMRIPKVQLHGRCIGALAILFQRIVRRKKARAGNDAMKAASHNEPFGKLAAFGHFAPGSARIRGRAQSRRISRMTLPTPRK